VNRVIRLSSGIEWVYGSDKEKSKILTRTHLYNKLYSL
jgi:hypothetical protein